MASTNPYPLEPGETLVPETIYGLRIPEFSGDPASVLPYSLVQHDLPPDVILIKATGKTSYDVIHRDSVPVEDMGQVHGAMPSLFEREGQADRRRPRRGGPMATPQAGTGVMADVSVAQAQASSVPDTGLMANTPAPPAASKKK